MRTSCSRTDQGSVPMGEMGKKVKKEKVKVENGRERGKGGKGEREKGRKRGKGKEGKRGRGEEGKREDLLGPLGPSPKKLRVSRKTGKNYPTRERGIFNEP